MQKFSNDMKKKYSLHLSGSGEINYNGEHKLSLVYESDLILNKNGSREVIVNVCIELLSRLNTDDTVKKSSKYYPYQLNNLSIGISFASVPKMDEHSIVMVLMTNDKVTFYTRNFLTSSFEEVDEETFENAIEIVNQDCYISRL